MIKRLLSWLDPKYPVSAEETRPDRPRLSDAEERYKAETDKWLARERAEWKSEEARISDHPAWMHLKEFAQAVGTGVFFGKDYRRGCGPGDWRGYYAYIVGTESFIHGRGETPQLAIEDLAKIIRGRRISIQRKGEPAKSWDVPPNLGIYQPEYPPGLSFVKESAPT